jgi:membrane protein implicated in regulation of membrane protease activity
MNDGDAPSLVALLRALIEDAQTLVEAEVGYWRTALGYALGRIRAIALLLVLALFLAFFTLMAIVVGLLLALAPLVGTWGALALVAVTLGLLTVASLRLAIRRGRRMIRLLTRPGAQDAP